jgi:hypothetical protein
MPLTTNNIHEAKSAYANLELRALASQQSVVTLQATVDTLSAAHNVIADNARLQANFTANQIAVNGTLTAQQAAVASPDLTLDNFIGSLGLSIALAEATMPDRAINSVETTVQSFLTFTPSADGVSKVAGLRLYQPELGAPSALATTSFNLDKMVSTPGTPVPRSLYVVLQTKQSVFADSYWTQFATGNPPAPPAVQAVAEIVKIFASIGSWSFPYVLGEAGTLARLESSLAGLLTAAKPSGPASAYAASVQALSALTQALSSRSFFVAGDLYALTAALDATTPLASALLQS